MLQLFIAYQPLVDLFLLHSGLALAQYLVLRAGVFSVANAGLTAIGAYLAAGLTLKAGVHPAFAMVLGAIAGMLVSMLLSCRWRACEGCTRRSPRSHLCKLCCHSMSTRRASPAERWG